MANNTTIWYVAKAIYFDAFKILKAHIVDDDNNEYTATIKGNWLRRGWYAPAELNIIDLEPYDSETWHEMEDDIQYTKAVKIA